MNSLREREKSFDSVRTSSGAGKRRSLSAGGVIARGPRRSGGGVFSLSIVFHISTRFFALPVVKNETPYRLFGGDEKGKKEKRERER